MYRSHILSLFCFAVLCIAANACQMDDIHRYGDRCKDWAYIQTEAGACSKDNLAACNSDYVFALNAGYCPDKYNKCAYDKDGAKFCRTGCPDEGQVLCNKLCISEADYQNAIVEQREDGEFCTPVTITCSDHCVNGCDEEGKCRCPENCQSCDANGACLITCPENCVNGCGKDGACLCPQLCANGCDADGSCKDPCKDVICKGANEQCQDGVCIDLCKDVVCNGANEQCQDGVCVDLCKDVVCKNTNEYCDMGNCLAEEDENGNHLSDRYETAFNQGKDCRRYSDCDSEVGKGDGFCDSFIGYKCSTKCTSDAQCFPHLETSEEPYKFVCREDGRCAPDSFITMWEIPENNKTLTLPVNGDSVMIDWGDGTQETISVSSDSSRCNDEGICGPTHEYTSAGEYIVIIKGKCIYGYPQDAKNNSTIQDAIVRHHAKLIEVKTFGMVEFSNSYIFSRCNNIKLSQIDIPNANNLNGYGMFARAYSFNQPLEHWDTSRVTKMSYMFQLTDAFNQPLDKWDTSNVTDMIYMFMFTKKFNQPLDKWDTSNVTDMKQMFGAAEAFNQPLNSWNVSNVTDMENMFAGTPLFNQSLDNWDTSKVTNMFSMFSNATAFDQALNDWNVSNVTNMTNMFRGATSFDQDLSSWTVKATSVTSMFDGSGLSQENYCKIQASQSWSSKPTMSEYTCK